MNHLVIVAHPREDSFNMTLMRTYVAELRLRGHSVIVRDLYRMGFNPVLTAADLVAIERGVPPHDIAEEQGYVTEAEVLTIIAPIWWRSLPAILKGYFDRVFAHNFAYALDANDEFKPLLAGKQAVIFTTLASTEEEIRISHVDRTVETVEDLGILAACGIQTVRHLFISPLAPGRTTRTMIDEWLENARDVVRNLF